MTMSRGEVWLVRLDPTIADEIRKTRPAIVVNHDGVGLLELRVIVPLTAWQDRFQQGRWLVRIDSDADNGLDKNSAADTFQVRCVSCQRFVCRLGRVSAADMDRVSEGLRKVLELS
jgi:mRNA interferase MazF